MRKPAQSDRPDIAANPYWPDSEWERSERLCPDCGMFVWQANWFDDPPEDGGACIGLKFICGSCGWVD